MSDDAIRFYELTGIAQLSSYVPIKEGDVLQVTFPDGSSVRAIAGKPIRRDDGLQIKQTFFVQPDVVELVE